MSTEVHPHSEIREGFLLEYVVMSPAEDRRAASEIIEAERTAYLETLSAPEPDWPPDVRIVYETLCDRLFQWGVEAQAVVEECGIGGHDIYSRFRYCTGYGIKEFVILHRLRLGKLLLHYEALSVSQVAFAVGYDSPSGFSKTFKRRVGTSPTRFRERREG